MRHRGKRCCFRQHRLEACPGPSTSRAEVLDAAGRWPLAKVQQQSYNAEGEVNAIQLALLDQSLESFDWLRPLPSEQPWSPAAQVCRTRAKERLCLLLIGR